MHTGARDYGGKKGSVFHGQGGKPETSRRDLREYYRQVDQAVTRFLRDNDQPLILACVADQASVYRDVNNYSRLLPQVITGNADELSEHQLHERGWPCMEQYLQEARRAAISNYQAAAHTTRTASEISAIMTAAHLGQVDTLLIKETASLEGKYNPVDQTVDYSESPPECDQDLIESAVAQTLLHRGEVVSVPADELPGLEAMVATLRY
jgi:hypothetical protein